MTVTLTTERLVLRHPTLGDLPECVAFWSSEGSDRAVGFVGPWQPVNYPEPEIGWNLWEEALEGMGLAFEAATAARDWFFATSGHSTAVSYTHPDNHRSHRLCARPGAVHDPETPQLDPPERIYRHFVKRGPA